jgi:hypothetical protein
MSFRPNAHDELIIDGVAYRIAEHPAAPGFPYGQEGRAGIVYCLQNPATASKAALKVFTRPLPHPRPRLPGRETRRLRRPARPDRLPPHRAHPRPKR